MKRKSELRNAWITPAVLTPQQRKEIAKRITTPRHKPAQEAIDSFIRRVEQALEIYDAGAKVTHATDTGKELQERSQDLINRLDQAASILSRMDVFQEQVIHQHFAVEQGFEIPRCKAEGGSIEGILRAIIRAARSHQEWDIDAASEKRPQLDKRRNMPFLSHVVQAWKAEFPTAKASPAEGAFQATFEYLVHHVIGDKEQSCPSLLRTARNEGIL